MSQNYLQKIKKLHQLLSALANILEQESEKNWIRAIKIMIEKTDKASSGECE